MNGHPTSYVVAVLLAAAGTACGNRILVGESPGGSPTGAGGDPVLGAAGAGGTIAGSSGTSGAATRQVKPLRISGADAITRVAAVLWQDKPDADLMQQAAAGHFTSTSDLYGAIRQMLADPKAAKGVGAFYRWWLDLDRVATDMPAKDPALYPAYTPALAADMANETETFGVKVTLDLDGSYTMLMTAPMTFLNARLADVYGVPNVQGDDLRQVDLDPKERAGLLTQPSLLERNSYGLGGNPSARGAQTVLSFFCLSLPPPPADATPVRLPGGLDTLTQRQVTEAISTTSASCAGCHTIMDPPGLALENFDAIGHWRATDNGHPVDVSGLRLINVVDPPVTLNGPIELAAITAQSPTAQKCMVKQWLAYSLAKSPLEIDDALVANVFPTFSASGLNLKELIVAVLTTDAFLAP